MQRKTWYSILGVDAMPLSLKNLLLSEILDWVEIHHNFYVVVQATKVPAQYI